MCVCKGTKKEDLGEIVRDQGRLTRFNQMDEQWK